MGRINDVVEDKGEIKVEVYIKDLGEVVHKLLNTQEIKRLRGINRKKVAYVMPK